jgi:hypothetical protein
MKTFAQKQSSFRKRGFSYSGRSNDVTQAANHRINPSLPARLAINNSVVPQIDQVHAEQFPVELNTISLLHFGHDFSQIPTQLPTLQAFEAKSAINQSGEKSRQEVNTREKAKDLGFHSFTAPVSLDRLPDFTYVPVAPVPIQRKPVISSPNDPFEHEADEIAEKVIQMREIAPIDSFSATIQRQCKTCEDEESKSIQTKLTPLATASTAMHTEMAVRATERGGEPLPEAVRSYFEPRFGYDFSHIRVHTNGEAANAAYALQARAYTIGRDIVFGSGEYAPTTQKGRRLLAHELVHTVQQGQKSNFSVALQKNRYSSDPVEHDKNRVIGAPVSNLPAGFVRPAPVMLSRASDDDSMRPRGGEQIAVVLHQATDEKIGTDEEAIFNALSGRSIAEIEIIKEAFQKLSKDKRSLEEVLNDELSGDDLSRALSLVQGGTSSMEAARRLWDAMRGLGTDEEAIYATVAGRTANQWVEIQRAYQTLTNKELLAELRDELTDSEWKKLQSMLPAPAQPRQGAEQTKEEIDLETDKRAAAIATQIRAAIDPPGTDEEALYGALTGRTETEMAAIATHFGGLNELDKRLQDELSAAEYEVVRPLLYPGNQKEQLHPLVVRLHEEINSWFPSKKMAESILGGRSGGDQQLIREVYFSLYKTSLDLDLRRAFGLDAFEEHKLSRLENDVFRKRWEEELNAGLLIMQQKYKAGEKNAELRGCWFPSAAELENRKDKPNYDTSTWQIPVQRNTDAPPPLSLDDPNSLGKGQSLDARADDYREVFEPRGTPHDAVTALFTNLHLWQCDCARYVEIALLYAWYKTLSVEEFNERFKGLRLRKQDTTGLFRDTYHNNADDLGIDEKAKTKNFDEKWQNAPVGTKVVWRNESSYARPPWREENAIKSRKEPDWRQDLYDAHPMEGSLPDGGKLLEKEVKMSLAENCADFPDIVFEITLPTLKQLKAQGLSNDFLAALVKLKGEKIEGTGVLWKKLGQSSPDLASRIRKSAEAKARDKNAEDHDMRLILNILGRPGTSDEKNEYIGEGKNKNTGKIKRLEFSVPR